MNTVNKNYISTDYFLLPNILIGPQNPISLGFPTAQGDIFKRVVWTD